MTTTSLRDELCAALKRNADFDDLLAIVLDYKARGASQRTTYDTLAGLWHELGCDVGDENEACESLGDLMDRVWGFCPSTKAIWNSSLSDAPNED